MMIANLSGKIAHIAKDHMIIAIGGVGLQVYTTTDLCNSLRAGESVFLHTYLVVREDALTLYGFETPELCDMFVLLLGVAGVGPRLALNIVSQLNPDAIRRAVLSEQPEIFARVPGVGRKTAQKVMLHLQDRIKPGLEDLERAGFMSDVDGEVISALTSLGYSVVEAQAAVQNIPRETPQELETRLRLALQYFSA
jgi:holliday junction DNA helicase RuvA